MRPTKRFQRSIAPDAAHDQSAHPSVSAGEAPSWICIGTTPDGHDGPLTQYDCDAPTAAARSANDRRMARRITDLLPRLALAANRPHDFVFK